MGEDRGVAKAGRGDGRSGRGVVEGVTEEEEGLKVGIEAAGQVLRAALQLITSCLLNSFDESHNKILVRHMALKELLSHLITLSFNCFSL